MVAGDMIGPYRVLAQIGEGGMGQVYRARDTKLDRDVALKILPEAFAHDADRLARFQREAKTLASLNHPNIAAIYGLEESGGLTALVMELVEGDDLSQRIAHGAIPVDEALPIAKQIAEALEAAHEQGIIHRDLKPANVKVRLDGTVKVLDFGLAKALAPDTASPTAEDIANSPTLTAHATQMGVILGTAAYMAPEQARGKPVDKRADIWAFGAVLYEMLTGRKPYPGDDVSQTLARVIDREPDWSVFPVAVPARIRQAIAVCLKKDPRQRVHDIADVRLALEGAFESAVAPPGDAAATVPGPQPASWRRAMPWIGGSAVGGLFVGLVVWMMMLPSPAPVARFPIPLGSDEALTGIGRPIVAISPDGRYVAYTANDGLVLRAVDQLQATVLSDTVGARNPFFSSDSQQIGFWAEGQLKRLSVSGGAPVTLGQATNPWGVNWGVNDHILYGQGPGGVWQVPSTGGTPEQVVALEEDEQAHGPQMLPGGEWVLFTMRRSGVGSWDQAEIVTQSVETGERTVLIEVGRDARYVSSGHLIYALNGVLLAVPFDVGRRRVTGGPVPLVEGVAVAPFQTGAAQFSLAENGSLVYVPQFATGPARRTLVWVDRAGREESVAAPPRAYHALNISPDGTRVALGVADEEQDIWIWDLARETLTRLTFDPERDRWPVWTPDGRRVVFESSRLGLANLFWKAADGTGTAERLAMSDNIIQAPHAISPDGTWLAFREHTPDMGIDLGLMSMESGHATEVLLRTEFDDFDAHISPDGRWFAYASDASGQNEVYVRPFPDANGGRWQISTMGGSHPLWAPDGRELFYVDARDRMMVVTVHADVTLVPSSPEVLFEGSYYLGAPGEDFRGYDIAPDGQRFLMIKDVGGAEVPSGAGIVLVLNWLEELKARVPTN